MAKGCNSYKYANPIHGARGQTGSNADRSKPTFGTTGQPKGRASSKPQFGTSGQAGISGRQGKATKPPMGD